MGILHFIMRQLKIIKLSKYRVSTSPFKRILAKTKDHIIAVKGSCNLNCGPCCLLAMSFILKDKRTKSLDVRIIRIDNPNGDYHALLKLGNMCYDFTYNFIPDGVDSIMDDSILELPLEDLYESLKDPESDKKMDVKIMTFDEFKIWGEQHPDTEQHLL